MKEYYILVYSHFDSERPNVEAPKIFKSHEEAFNEMCSQLANITEYSIGQLKESYFTALKLIQTHAYWKILHGMTIALLCQTAATTGKFFLSMHLIKTEKLY